MDDAYWWVAVDDIRKELCVVFANFAKSWTKLAGLEVSRGGSGALIGRTKISRRAPVEYSMILVTQVNSQNFRKLNDDCPEKQNVQEVTTVSQSKN
jgi:hypothetical protein